MSYRDDKYEEYYNNINIIEEKLNYDKTNIKDDLIFNKEIIYDKFKDTTSFADIISRVNKLNQARRAVQSQTRPSAPTSSQQSIINQTNQIQSTPQAPQTPTQPQTPPAATTTQTGGKTYDANRMWSPQSWAGIVYEWNRGVIGISPEGEIEKEKLDGTINHHGGATLRIVNTLGVNLQNPNADSEPFQMAIDGASEGILIFQSEGDNGFVYFPAKITEGQLEGLSAILTPRQGFDFSYTFGEEIFTDQTLQDVLTFATNLKDNTVEAKR